jgi:hypothetical protein
MPAASLTTDAGVARLMLWMDEPAWSWPVLVVGPPDVLVLMGWLRQVSLTTCGGRGG